MRGRHDIRWYAELGAGFFIRAAGSEGATKKARLLTHDRQAFRALAAAARAAQPGAARSAVPPHPAIVPDVVHGPDADAGVDRGTATVRGGATAAVDRSESDAMDVARYFALCDDSISTMPALTAGGNFSRSPNDPRLKPSRTVPLTLTRRALSRHAAVQTQSRASRCCRQSGTRRFPPSSSCPRPSRTASPRVRGSDSGSASTWLIVRLAHAADDIAPNQNERARADKLLTYQIHFMTAPRVHAVLTSSEQDRHVENEPAIVVDHGVAIDDAAVIPMRHHDQFTLDVHRHRAHPLRPSRRQIASRGSSDCCSPGGSGR